MRSNIKFSWPVYTVLALAITFIGFNFTTGSHAGGVTYKVAAGGNNTVCANTAAAFSSIATAVNCAAAGDTVSVGPGVYHEQIGLSSNKSGINLIGTGKPVIDGDNLRASAINLTNGVHDVTIAGFELRNFTASGSGRSGGILAYNTFNSIIRDNDIHDSHSANAFSYGIVLGTNSLPYSTHDVTVIHNRVHDIGPGGESMGIWMMYTKNMTIDGNEMYLVRKEGLRDWVGISNTIKNNKAYLNWIGIEMENSQKDLVSNNYVYNNIYGLAAKHTANATANGAGPCPIQPDTYDKNSAGQVDKSNWTRFWHNTAYKNSASGVALGISASRGDYLDVEDNIFASNGDDGAHDWPGDSCGHIYFDGNVYSSGPASLQANDYAQDWCCPIKNIKHTVTDLRSLAYDASFGWTGWTAGQPLGYEAHGQDVPVAFKDPLSGDLDYLAPPPQPGIMLSDSLGAQIGARGLGPASLKWDQYPLTAIAASSHPPSTSSFNANRTTDNVFGTYWWSNTQHPLVDNHDQFITYDLGAAKTFQQIVVPVFQHLDNRTTKAYDFEVSNDNVTFHSILSGTNPDTEGSSYKYDLPQPVTARYVKYVMKSTFGGPYMLIRDFQVGLLSSGTASPPPPVLSGDVNGDGQVNVVDLSILLSHFNAAGTTADLNKDGHINIIDLSILLSHFGK